ncbi:MAG TPA: tetratricopeptide repeat protein, partial [Gemmataceae bacterium]|nr:tetratricopeptide repeat protein [Gemmataceae bacterium]
MVRVLRAIMLNLPYLQEFWPLWLLQVAFTIWMLTDMQRRGLDYYWFYIILFFQPFGAWVYFFLYKLPHLQLSTGLLAGLFTRPASLDELYHRAEQSPMPAAWLALGERLVQLGKLEEARSYLERVVAREPEHSQALFLLATCHRGLGQPDQAVPLLQRVVTRQPNWRDYKAWHILIEV